MMRATWLNLECNLCGVGWSEAANSIAPYVVRGNHVLTYCDGCRYLLSKADVLDPDEERTGRSREEVVR